MSSGNLGTAVLFLSLTVVSLLVISVTFFPRASCLTTGPHYSFCEIGRVPTLSVLFVAVVALPIAVWRVGSE